VGEHIGLREVAQDVRTGQNFKVGTGRESQVKLKAEACVIIEQTIVYLHVLPNLYVT
jgi:hypothetical protein